MLLYQFGKVKNRNMKKFIIIAMLLFSALSFGQSYKVVNIKAGPSGGSYFTLNGQDYARGNAFLIFTMTPRSSTGDTGFSIGYAYTKGTIVSNTSDTFFYFQDSSKYCRSASVLQAWLRAIAY